MNRNERRMWESTIRAGSKPRPPQRICLCTLSAEGMETESGRQDWDGMVNDPQIQLMANELRKPITMTGEFGVHVWTPVK